MKNIKSWAAGVGIAIMLSVSAIAQTSATVPVPSKIGWVNTGTFADEKTGVTRFVNALKSIDGEFKPKVTELEGIQTRLNAIGDELRNTGNAAVPMKPETIQAKRDEGERLQREAEFKKKEFEVAYARRRNEVIGPISADIIKAMQEFARQKGYAVILDIGTLAQANAILVLEPSADITTEFTAFYNARPAVTALAVPK